MNTQLADRAAVDILQLGGWLASELAEALTPRFRLLPAWQQPDPFAYAAAHGADVRAILTHSRCLPVDDRLLPVLPRLALVLNLSAGAEAVDAEALAARGIPFLTGSGANAVDVAELAFGMLLAISRDLLRGDRQVRQEQWPGLTPVVGRVAGRRLGLVGMGAIGKEIARRAQAFDMHVAYYARRPVAGDWRFVGDLLQLAREADFLVLALPGGPATRHLVDAAVLDALGPEGYLVNVARGSVVDEKALIAALQQGRIAGAALDVFEHEPQVPAALRESDRVLLLPHRGGVTRDAFRDVAKLTVDRLLAHFPAS
jgi:lactate dehydrogenase-like 2-hydroxyacid dehydrogenase